MEFNQDARKMLSKSGFIINPEHFTIGKRGVMIADYSPKQGKESQIHIDYSKIINIFQLEYTIELHQLCLESNLDFTFNGLDEKKNYFRSMLELQVNRYQGLISRIDSF